MWQPCFYRHRFEKRRLGNEKNNIRSYKVPNGSLNLYTVRSQITYILFNNNKKKTKSGVETPRILINTTSWLTNNFG